MSASVKKRDVRISRGLQKAKGGLENNLEYAGEFSSILGCLSSPDVLTTACKGPFWSDEAANVGFIVKH